MVVPVPDQLEYISDADGVTTEFPYPKRFLQSDEIVVLLRDADGVDTQQYLNQHYSIAGSSWPNGGTVSFYNAPAAGLKVVRTRMTQAKQSVDLENKQRNDAKAVELQLDRLTMAQQDKGRVLDDLSARAIKVPHGDIGGILNAGISSMLLHVDATGNISSSETPANEKTERENGDRAIASLIGQFGPVEPHVYESVLAASHANIKPTITNIKTGGFADPKDLGGANYYKKSQLEPDRGGDFTSIFSGERWGLSDPFPNIIMFGGISGSASLNDAAFIAAQDYGKPLYLPDGEYHASFVPSIPCYGPGVVIVNGKRLKGSRTAQRLKGEYIGQVATRCGAMFTVGGSARQMMSKTMHQARDDIGSLQVVFANWILDGTSEVGSGNAITITASIEYPEGQFTQIKWSGSTSVVIADGLTAPPSDALEVHIPNGATFAVRSYIVGTSSILWGKSRDQQIGDACVYAPSGLSDYTMGGVIGQTGGSSAEEIYRPLAIIARTSKPSVAIIGDSREVGITDTFSTTGNKGYVERSISDVCAFINLSRSGDKLINFIADHDRRAELARYCSHIVVHMGINDINAGASASAVKDAIETIIGYFPDQAVWTATIDPRTTSIDGWTTISGQTGFASNVRRVEVNNYIRAGLIGADGFFEIADVLESGRNTGFWRVYAGKALTGDGLHANRLGNQVLEDSLAVNPAVFFDRNDDIPNFASAEVAAEGRSANKAISPASLAGRPYFTAVKAGNIQTVAAATQTDVSFELALRNIGRYYDAATGVFKPPAGRYHIKAQVTVNTGLVAGNQNVIMILKNGAYAASFYHRAASANGASISISRVFETDGNDEFKIAVNLSGAVGGEMVLTGNNQQTYFEGYSV